MASLANEPVIIVPLKPDAPLVQLVALARRLEKPNPRSGFDEVRCEALRLLAQQPKGTSKREKAIRDALQNALDADHQQVRNAGAAGLARRGGRAEMTGLVSRLESDPQAFVAYFRALESPQHDPPIARLRSGLNSSRPAARAAVAEVIGLCRVKELAGELQRGFEAETDPAVRDQSAIALTLLGAPDARGALLRLRKRGHQSISLARALIEMGGDEEVEALLPLLWDTDAELRNLVAEGIGKMALRDRAAAIRGLLLKLRDSSPQVRIAAAETLARFREAQAIPVLREILPAARDYSVEERKALVRAVVDFGEALAIPLLNEMLDWSFREECGLETALADFGHPSSGVAAWKAYADDLNYVILGGYLVGEYRKALPVVAACADAELLATVRDTAAAVPRAEIRKSLQELAEKIAERLAEKASDQRPPPRSFPPAPFALALRDSDDDGVPDLRDKYPTDNRRVADIPVTQISFPEKRFAVIPLRALAPDAPAPQFLAIDDDSRVGYLTEEIVDDATVFRVVSADGFGETREWLLPDPGRLAGIEKLAPSAMQGNGTLIGTALWKPEAGAALPAGDSRLAPGSGFVFNAGKLTLDPAAPVSPGTLRSSYKRIDQHGRIFGHREERDSAAPDAPIRTVAFYGKHVFREVPSFEVAAISSNGCLLCYRDTAAGRENFIWDGARFIPIRADAASNLRRLSVRAVAMNAKLQVIGQLEQAGRPLAAFFWENGTLRLLAALIPDRHRMWMQTIEPRFIRDDGCISFAAQLVGDRSKPPRPQSFDLTLRPGAENLLERYRFIE